MKLEQWLSRHFGNSSDRHLSAGERSDLLFAVDRWFVSPCLNNFGEWQIILSAMDYRPKWDAPGDNIVWCKPANVWIYNWSFDDDSNLPVGGDVNNLEFESCQISFNLISDLCNKWNPTELTLGYCDLLPGRVVSLLDVPNLKGISSYGTVQNQKYTDVFNLISKHLQTRDHFQLQCDLIDAGFEEFADYD